MFLKRLARETTPSVCFQVKACVSLNQPFWLMFHNRDIHSLLSSQRLAIYAILKYDNGF